MMLVILDLDETLIRCTSEWWDFAPHSSFRIDSYVYHMYARPYLSHFLNRLAAYRIAVWIAATRDYAISMCADFLVRIGSNGLNFCITANTVSEIVTCKCKSLIPSMMTM